MNDINAFERLVADVADDLMGPSRSFDTAAIVQSAKTMAPRSRWTDLVQRTVSDRFAPTEGGFHMVSALKFIAAGVIVALFGGFLLAGVLTTPDVDEVVPAAVTESPGPEATTATEPTESPGPSVRTDILPGVTLTVEEVEPGFYRVLDDGVRDLSERSEGMFAGHDGSIWLLRRSKDFIRLGSPAVPSHQWPRGRRAEFVAEDDGTVWMHDVRTDSEGKEINRFRSNDGESWTVRLRAPALGPVRGRAPIFNRGMLTIAPDDTVWAAYAAEDEQERLVVARLGDDGWEPLGGSIPLGTVGGLFVTESGEVWVTAQVLRLRDDDGAWREVAEGRIWRYRDDDGGWQEVTVDAVLLDSFINAVEVGADGTVWLAGIEPLMADGRPVLDAEGDMMPGDSVLMRFEGTEWQRWGHADGMPSLRSTWGDIVLEQAPDGGLWMFSQKQPPFLGDPRYDPLPSDMGVFRFDGSTWQRFQPLDGPPVEMVAPGGAVWVLLGDLYVITQEAVTATE